MNMSFLDKGSLSIVVIILIAIVIGFAIGFGGFFYWHKTYVPADNPPEDISREEIKAKCIENVSKMTDEELINEVKNFKNSNKISVSTKENLLNPLYKNMINYLICKVEYDKSEENYNRAKNFMESLAYMIEENKQSVLDKLDDAYFDLSKNTFTIQLALGDLDKICPNELPNLCLEEITENNNLTPITAQKCLNICNTLQQYSGDRDKLEQETIKFQDWSDDLSIQKRQYQLRTAMAYRFGRYNLALQVCENINQIEKNNCVSRIEIIKSREEIKQLCTSIREELESLICRDD